MLGGPPNDTDMQFGRIEGCRRVLVACVSAVEALLVIIGSENLSAQTLRSRESTFVHLQERPSAAVGNTVHAASFSLFFYFPVAPGDGDPPGSVLL